MSVLPPLVRLTESPRRSPLSAPPAPESSQ
jgi:hypothetical protein